MTTAINGHFQQQKCNIYRLKNQIKQQQQTTGTFKKSELNWQQLPIDTFQKPN